MDIHVRRADYKHEQAFMSSLPILQMDADIERKSKRNVLTLGAAAAFPFSSFELCDQKWIFQEENQAYRWTRLDTQQKLLKLFSEKGFRAKVLERTVKPEDREEWVNEQVKKGCQILITNPSLVETGLDLNDFTTLVFYNIAYNLYIFRQASRRSWRINQKAPRVEVYMFYYTGTMQYRAIKLMASKLAAATVIEGNISDEGLAAMSDCQDMYKRPLVFLHILYY